MRNINDLYSLPIDDYQFCKNFEYKQKAKYEREKMAYIANCKKEYDYFYRNYQNNKLKKLKRLILLLLFFSLLLSLGLILDFLYFEKISYLLDIF